MRSLALVLALLFGGCGSDSVGGELLDVYAASSLTEVFRDMEIAFEASQPGVDVRITFAGSQVLRLQIEQGAPADIFASANLEHMQALVAAGLVSGPQTLAHNDLVLIVPLENPAEIESFEELPQASRIVLGTEHTPAGRYGREVLKRASEQLGSEFEQRVMDRVVSEESNVRLARAKVELGEADAALVYRTDALESEGLSVLEIPERMGVEATYVIAEVARSDAGAHAREWVDFVLSMEGRDVFRARGFRVE